MPPESPIHNHSLRPLELFLLVGPLDAGHVLRLLLLSSRLGISLYIPGPIRRLPGRPTYPSRPCDAFLLVFLILLTFDLVISCLINLRTSLFLDLVPLDLDLDLFFLPTACLLSPYSSSGLVSSGQTLSGWFR